MAAASALLLLSTVAFALACDENTLKSCLFGGGFEFRELTHEFGARSVYWPGSRRFQFIKEQAGERADGSWYAANDFCAGEHGGTHLDAPYHFAATGAKVGDIGLDKLIVPLYVVDVSSQVHDDPNFVLYKHNLDHMLNVFDTTRPCLVLFKFGWSKFYPDVRRYLGVDGVTNATLNFPGLSEEVAKFIVTSYPNVVGVGADVASIDPGSSSDFPAHKTLLGAGLYLLENVKLDQQLPEIKCTALVLPMKISQGTGAPLRLIAICPRQEAVTHHAKDFV